MIRFLSCLFVTAFVLSSLDGAEIVRLWSTDAPGAKGKRDCDIPTLTIYFPTQKTANPRPAVIVCPGGAYSFLATELEGNSYARFLNQHGLVVFVLKYRLGSPKYGTYRYPIPQQDALRAVRLVRFHSAKWNLDPGRIGIMGSSAGGHVAAMTAVKNDDGNPKSSDAVERCSSRPDFVILCYAQTSMDKRYGSCAGSRNLLLGKDSKSTEDVAAYKFVTDETPPCFLWHTFEDRTVPVRNALDFANALEANLVPFSLHIYHGGNHGMGLGKENELHPWSSELIFWLREINVITK